MTDSPDIPLHTANIDGLAMRYADMGEGPLVMLFHGWPESWFSWRHQIQALAEAGYRVIAPDMPGYGKTGKLADTSDYNIINITDYLIALLNHVSDEGRASTAILCGHDWGAAIAWHTVQLYPSRFTRLVIMSVPFNRHAKRPPMDIYRQRFGKRFFYQIYFQTPGVAEAEFDNDPRGILSRLYCSPEASRLPPAVSDTSASAGGWIDRLGEPEQLPDWLTEEELDYYVKEFTEAGFQGGLNYYRNIDRNWELMAPYAENSIDLPVLFIAGEKDMVIGGATREQLMDLMKPRVPNLQNVILLPEMGHWIQQEAPGTVNALVLDFLKDSA